MPVLSTAMSNRKVNHMPAIIRLYESESALHQIAADLEDAEIGQECVMAINPADFNAAAIVDEKVQDGTFKAGQREALVAALARGRWVVAASPHFLVEGTVERILDRSHPVDAGTVPEYMPSSPAPFSDFLSIPVLMDSKSEAGLFDFDSTSSFGLDLLSNNATPLSSLFGLPVLSKKKGSSARGSSVERMSGKAAPLSSIFKMKLLSSKSSSAKGSSVERMASNPAPFSSLLGLRVLSKRD
jgi:hypothetical protein